MTDSLLQVARRYADTHVDADGVARTPYPGLAILRETTATPITYAICKPLVALVLQGAKRVSMGSSTFDFGAGESLLITTDVPTVSQITRASAAAPYYAFVVELDPAVIASLVAEMGASPFTTGSPVRVDPTEAEVADAALRLMKLLERASLGPHPERPTGPRVALLAVVRPPRRRHSRPGCDRQPCAAYRTRRRVDPFRLRQALASRTVGRGSGHERFGLPCEFSGDYVAHPLAVPEAASPDRGPAFDARRGRSPQHGRLRGRL